MNLASDEIYINGVTAGTAGTISHELAHYLRLLHPTADGEEFPTVDGPWVIGGPITISVDDNTLALYALALIHSYLGGENRSAEIEWGTEDSKFMGLVSADKMLSEGIPLMKTFTHELRLLGGAYVPVDAYNYYTPEEAERLREGGFCGLGDNFCGLEGTPSSIIRYQEWYLPRKSAYATGAIPNSSLVVGFSDKYPDLYRCGWADAMGDRTRLSMTRFTA